MSNNILLYATLNFIITVLAIPYLKKATKHARIWQKKIGLAEILFCFSLILYVFLSAFRTISPQGYGGTDAPAYRDFFYAAENVGLFHYVNGISPFEPLFSLIMWTSYNIVPNYSFALIIWHTLSFILLERFLKNNLSSKIGLTEFLAVYATNFILFEQYNTLRMTIAITILLDAFSALSDGKTIVFILKAISACLIQVSAIIFIPATIFYIIFSNRTGFTKGKLACALVAGVLGSLSLIRVFAHLLEMVGKSVYAESGAISWGVYFPILILIMFGARQHTIIEKQGSFSRMILYILPSCLVCFPLQAEFAIVYRMTLYFLPLTNVFIIKLLEVYRANPKSAEYLVLFLLGNGYLLYRIFSTFTEETIHFGIFKLIII